ncbi:hypothetical protein DFH09DRAFT_1105735 [Mycena vulgaris]|nr:hypothetical protein DFH09DRAFT_1105735 [Mycena vulgaris]
MPKADPLHSFSPRRSPAILRDCVRDSAASKRRRTKGYPVDLSLAFGMEITAMLWREPNIPPVQITFFPREDLRVRLSDHKPALAAVGFEPQTDQLVHRYFHSDDGVGGWRPCTWDTPLLVSDVGDTLLLQSVSGWSIVLRAPTTSIAKDRSSTHPAGTAGNQVSFKIILEAALAASGVIDGELEGDDEMPELEEVEESSDKVE